MIIICISSRCRQVSTAILSNHVALQLKLGMYMCLRNLFWLFSLGCMCVLKRILFALPVGNSFTCTTFRTTQSSLISVLFKINPIYIFIYSHELKKSIRLTKSLQFPLISPCFNHFVYEQCSDHKLQVIIHVYREWHAQFPALLTIKTYIFIFNI